MRRFPWILTVACLLTFALLVSLGAWQVRRLQWKEGLIAQAQAAAERPAAPLDALLETGQPLAFRRVTVTCPGLATAPFVELQSIQDGQAGVRLISACPLGGPEGERVFLVDRGFVADTVSARPAQTPSSTGVPITAVVRDTPSPGPMAVAADGRRFYARDVDTMARALGVAAQVDPRTLFALTSSNPEWDALRPSAPPAAFSNNHLGYAATWFGLALALLGFYVALLRRHFRGPADRRSTPEGRREDPS